MMCTLEICMTPAPFTERKIHSFQTLSERFIAARKLRGLSLNEVAHSIGVQERYLHALEEGRFQDLPADVYARGFVTRYAAAMNLPQHEMLKLYDHERGVSSHVRKVRGEEQESVVSFTPSDRRSWFSPKVLKWGVFVFITVGLVLYLIVQFRALSAPPSLHVLEPATNVTIDAQTFTVSGTVEEGSMLLLNGSDVRVSADGMFSVDIPLEEGENILQFIATSPLEKQTVVERTILVPERSVPEPMQDPMENTTIDVDRSSPSVEGEMQEGAFSDQDVSEPTTSEDVIDAPVSESDVSGMNGEE